MSRLAVVILTAVFLVSGCSAPVARRDAAMASMGEGPAAAYGERPALTTSLFKSDQAVMDDEAIRRILSSKVVLAEHARIALLKFPGAENAALRYYGYHYRRSEDYLKTQQEYIDTISRKLTASEHVAEVILLPSLLTPPQATIPTLREAAVRLQADLLLVFRLTSDIYYQPRLFAQDQIKAYCTCEAVLLDVRTGLVPLTTITTKDRLEKKERQDLDINETMRRAETAAVLDSLRAASDKLADFLQSTPPSTP